MLGMSRCFSTSAAVGSFSEEPVASNLVAATRFRKTRCTAQRVITNRVTPFSNGYHGLPWPIQAYPWIPPDPTSVNHPQNSPSRPPHSIALDFFVFSFSITTSIIFSLFRLSGGSTHPDPPSLSSMGTLIVSSRYSPFLPYLTSSPPQDHRPKNNTHDIENEILVRSSRALTLSDRVLRLSLSPPSCHC